MEYTLKDGRVLTEADFEELEEAAAQGRFPGEPGEWVVRPQGRPRLTDEDLVAISFKVPRSQRAKANATASARGESLSQFMREVLRQALA